MSEKMKKKGTGNREQGSGILVDIYDGISIKQAEALRGLLMSARKNLVDALFHAKTDPDVAESYLRCAEPFELVKNRNIIRLYYFYKGIVVAITSLGLAVVFKKGSAMPVIRYARKAGAK